MSATPKTLQPPHRPGAISERSCDDPLRRNAVQNRGERSNDATASLLLDVLMQSPPDACCAIDTIEHWFKMLVDQGSSLDDLVDVSATMRGLIFRAYARRISDLMLAQSTVDPTAPRPVMGGRLH